MICVFLKLSKIAYIVHELLRQYHAEYAILFGLYARSEANPDSHIDIIVFGGEGFIPKKIFEFAEDLREKTGLKVDAFEIHEVNQNTDFYKNIRNEGIRIVE